MEQNNKEFILSFEFFPPKTSEGQFHLHNTAKKLAELNPDFFSVTFGAGGTTRDGTLDTVKWLKQEMQCSVAPHLSCIASTREELINLIEEYKSFGVNRIVALRGDLPSGMGQGGELKYASDLVKLIREETADYFKIEVAAYPEVHPQAKNAHQDIMNLKKKVEAGANSALTQYFFNPDAYFYFVDDCIRHGIFIPIVPGIMPIINFHKLVRFSESCGAEIPLWLRRRLEAFADDEASMKSFGLEIVYNLCEALIAGGAPGLHFYTLNHYEASEFLVKALLSHSRESGNPYSLQHGSPPARG